MIRTLTIAAFAAGTLALPAAAVEDVSNNIASTAELLETATGAKPVYEESSDAAEEDCEPPQTGGVVTFRCAGPWAGSHRPV